MWVTSTGIYNIKVKTKKIFEYLFKKIKSLHIDINYVRKTNYFPKNTCDGNYFTFL